MNPGLLDRLVQIQRVTTAKNSGGVAAETWANLTRVWAKKEDTGGSESLNQQQGIAPESDTKFTIRFLDVLTTKDRITFEGKTYDLLSIAEIGRHEFQKIGAKVRVTP